jgi:hypothetical protein
MTVKELIQKILLETPNRLDSDVYFDVPLDDIFSESYEIDEITSCGANDSLYFILKKI